jgi:electron transport complex protein RnfD
MSSRSPTDQADVSPAGDGRDPSASGAHAPLQVAPSPHLADSGFSTRRMMIDVLIGMAPVVGIAVYVFHWYAVVQVGFCILGCVGTELALNRLGGRASSLGDWSAVVTGVILGLSLPWSSPWYVPVLGSVVAIGLGKAVFGGLGCNIFNPAMVGRAFVMLSFARQMGAPAYIVTGGEETGLDVVTQATPLAIAKQLAADFAAGRVTAGDLQVQLDHAPKIWALFIGQVNGSLGETSALAIALGGLYLLVRRVISWEIPAGVLLVSLVAVELGYYTELTPFGPLHHLISGSLLFGAFFIATDPVTSPLTSRGKLIYGMGIGLLVVVMRLFSSYPEGVMFAVLVMNAAVPLLNRWTIPRPLGGIPPSKNAKA